MPRRRERENDAPPGGERQSAAWLARLEGVFSRIVEAYRGGDASLCRGESAALVERVVFVRLAQAAGWAPRELLADLALAADALAAAFDETRRATGDSLFFASSGDDAVEPAELGREPRGDPHDFAGEALVELVCQTRPLAEPDEASGLPPEFLGELHQRLLKTRCGGQSAVAARRSGVYYTPPYVADHIIAAALAQFQCSKSAADAVRVLDPACGCGAFLLAADRATRRVATDGPPTPPVELYGIDSDPGAVVVARRSLLLALAALAAPATLVRPARPASPAAVQDLAALAALATRLGRQIRWANALADSLAASQPRTLFDQPLRSFPGRFDVVVGNPPYHRELGGKEALDALARSDLGRRHRTARMDLWHYFLHRGLEWLAPGGVLSYIVPEYWVAGRSGRAVVDAIRRTCCVAEVFLLEDRPVFEGVSGRHLILTLVRERSDRPATIRRAAPGESAGAADLLAGRAAVHCCMKGPAELFVDGGLRLEEPHPLDHSPDGCVPLGELAMVRQGIVENPAAVTRLMCERHRGDWTVGEGVFVLRPDEVERLGLSPEERAVLRPYHELSDLGRYYLASEASKWLIYSTADTWPDVDRFPRLRDHLARFRPILERRRETQQGRRPWWQLHWPRDAATWLAPKIIAVQMAARPAFAVAQGPVWTPFSVNVLLPADAEPQELHYLAAVLNSRLAWDWFRRHAKHRGVGLDINGHVLRRFPVRRLGEALAGLTTLATERAAVEVSLRTSLVGDSARATALDAQIDRLVDALYGERFGSPH